MKHPAGKKENMNGEKIERIDNTTTQLLAKVNALTESNKTMVEFCEKMDRDLKAERLMNRMCFSLLFRVGNLPEDRKTLDAILKKKTIFDSVLEDVTNQMFYNGHTPHYGE
jgi:hypothetical protein